MNPNFEKTPKSKTEQRSEKPSFSDKVRKTFMGGVMGVAMMVGTESQAQENIKIPNIKVNNTELVLENSDAVDEKSNETTLDVIAPVLQIPGTMENLINFEKELSLERGDTISYEQAVNKVVEAFEALKFDTLSKQESRQINEMILRSDLFRNFKLSPDRDVPLESGKEIIERIHSVSDEGFSTEEPASVRVRFIQNLLDIINLSSNPDLIDDIDSE